MFCNKCGSQLPDDALFCDVCGAKVELNRATQKTNNDGEIYKCPYCGELLSSDDLKCPSCGNEIRGKEAAKSVKAFFDSIITINDVDKLIKAIKTYPIPNGREDVIEFMLLASSNFDAKEYLTNKYTYNVAEAWLSKIEQCYSKAHMLFTDKNDLIFIEKQYKAVKNKIKLTNKKKILLIVFGFVGIALGNVVIVVFSTIIPVAIIGLLFLIGGIISLVFGFKRKKKQVKSNPRINQLNDKVDQDNMTVPVASNNSASNQSNMVPVGNNNQLKSNDETISNVPNNSKNFNHGKIKPIKAPATAYFVECPHCDFEIRYDLNQVRAHRKWPNGFIYCPNCDKPVGHNKYNHIEYEIVFETRCPKCHKNVIYDLGDVIQHRRWPNGYFDCPYCKTHIGHNKENKITFE